MATDQTIIKDFDERYNEAYYAWDAFFPEAETDLRFFLGDQWDEQEKRKLFQEGRSTFVFNRTRKNIQLITGYQRKNRLSSVVVPIEDSDQKTADQLSQLLLYVMQFGEGYHQISDCFAGGLKTGWNLLSIWMDYRDDPINGDIRFSREPYNAFITDPYFTRLDLSDCGYLLRRKYLNVDQCISLLPEYEKELIQLNKVGWERDDKFTWLPYQTQPSGQKMMAYNEFYEQKWRNVPMLVDKTTGEYMEFDVPQDRIELMLSLHEDLTIVKKPKRYIKRHIIVNDVAIKSDENPYGLNEYNVVPFVGIFEPESDQWGLKMQSLIRCQRDPQKESNRRRSQMSDLLDSQINSGWIAKENSVVNPRSLFQTSQGKVIWKKQDAQPDSLEKIPPAQIPPSMFQLQETYDRDMMEILGINDASFGITESGNESGVMMMLRQGATITNLQDVFDNLRFCQRMVSKKVLKLIQTWTPEKVKRIINEEPTKEFYNREFSKYDVAVQEGVLTDTQRQMNFRQMMDLYQLTGGPGQSPITPQMLYKAAPFQGKSDVNEEIMRNEQAQAQQAQKQAQIQEQLLTSQQQMAQAKAISDLALSKERFTRSVANLGLEDERASKAIEDRSSAALERVRAMKELQSMDDDRLFKYLSIIRMMEETNARKEDQVKEDNVQVSERAIAPIGNNPRPQMSGLEQMSQLEV